MNELKAIYEKNMIANDKSQLKATFENLQT